MTDREAKPRSSNASIVLLVLFGGYETAQALAGHDRLLLFGTWLALTAALVLSLRLPDTRAWFVRHGRLHAAMVVAEASWVLLAAAALVVALVSGQSAAWVWAGGGLAGAVLTPLALLLSPRITG